MQFDAADREEAVPLRRYLLRRVEVPADLELAEKDGESDRVRQALGGQPHWFWGFPGVVSALASPRSWAPVPAPPLPETWGDE